MGLSQVALGARKHNIIDEKTGIFTVQAAFSTLTNVESDIPHPLITIFLISFRGIFRFV